MSTYFKYFVSNNPEPSTFASAGVVDITEKVKDRSFTINTVLHLNATIEELGSSYNYLYIKPENVVGFNDYETCPATVLIENTVVTGVNKTTASVVATATYVASPPGVNTTKQNVVGSVTPAIHQGYIMRDATYSDTLKAWRIDFHEAVNESANIKAELNFDFKKVI